MRDYPLYWLRDSLGYFWEAAQAVVWGFRCLWWSALSGAQYIWYIKIRHEIE